MVSLKITMDKLHIQFLLGGETPALWIIWVRQNWDDDIPNKWWSSHDVPWFSPWFLQFFHDFSHPKTLLPNGARAPSKCPENATFQLGLGLGKLERWKKAPKYGVQRGKWWKKWSSNGEQNSLYCLHLQMGNRIPSLYCLHLEMGRESLPFRL